MRDLERRTDGLEGIDGCPGVNVCRMYQQKVVTYSIIAILGAFKSISSLSKVLTALADLFATLALPTVALIILIVWSKLSR